MVVPIFEKNMLYQVQKFDIDSGHFTIDSGKLAFKRVVLGAGQQVKVSLRQLIPNPHDKPQDRSMRAWFGKAAGGRSLMESTPFDSFNLTALLETKFTLYDEEHGVVPSDHGIAIPAKRGIYILNVLNLVNEQNTFAVDVVYDSLDHDHTHNP